MLHHLRRAFTLSACLGVLSCSEDPNSTLVVALSSEAPLPQGVESVSIQVKRGGKLYLNQTYQVIQEGQEPPLAPNKPLTVRDIPGTLTLRDEQRAEGPVQVQIVANLVTGDGTQRRRTIRNASLNFVEGKQRLLRMPIQLSCADLTCPQQQTCRAGLCVAETIQDDEFEEFEEERVIPVQGRCFDRNTCAGGNPENITRFEIEDVIDLLQEDCTVPYLFPERFEEDKAAAEATDPEDARLAAIRGSINMGYVWSGDYNIANAGKDLASATWTVVDKDPREGWEFANLSPSEAARSNPDATRRVVLAPGLCQALKADRKAIQLARTKPPYVRPPTRLLGTIEKRGCAPKPVTQPECQP